MLPLTSSAGISGSSSRRSRSITSVPGRAAAQPVVGDDEIGHASRGVHRLEHVVAGQGGDDLDAPARHEHAHGLDDRGFVVYRHDEPPRQVGAAGGRLGAVRSGLRGRARAAR